LGCHPALEPLDGGHGGGPDLRPGTGEARSGPGPPGGADEPTAAADPRAARPREREAGGGEARVDGHGGGRG